LSELARDVESKLARHVEKDSVASDSLKKAA
jgi:hypothetical protein